MSKIDPTKPLHLPLQIWKEREGKWNGNQRMWLTPGEPPMSSPARATVAISDDLRHVEFNYDWTHKERRQTAVITSLIKGNGRVELKWSDMFHTSGASMPFRGRVDTKGFISVRGAYEDEWSWRIDLEPTGPKSIRLAMYNVSPEKKEELAVEIIFRRDADQ